MIFIIPAIICTIFNLAENSLVAFGYEILMAILFVLYLLTSEIIAYGANRKNRPEGEEVDIDEQNKTLFDNSTKMPYIYYDFEIKITNLKNK